MLRVVPHGRDLLFRPLVATIDHILVALQNIIVETADTTGVCIPDPLIELRVFIPPMGNRLARHVAYAACLLE